MTERNGPWASEDDRSLVAQSNGGPLHISRLRAKPSDELKEALLEFTRPEVRSKLAGRAMLLTAPQYVSYHRNDEVEREILDYRRRLTYAPDITELSFRLKNTFEAGITKDDNRLVLSVRTHLAKYATRICAEPFYEESDPKELPLIYSIPMEDALPLERLKVVYKETHDRFKNSTHPSVMKTPGLGLAPFDLRVNSLALLVRH